MFKLSKEKKLWKVLFWDDSGKLIKTVYRYAYSWKQAKNIVYRMAIQGGWDYFFQSDNISITVGEEIKEPEQPKEQLGVCPKCGQDAEYDYCTQCGWERLSSWYKKGLSKVGII